MRLFLPPGECHMLSQLKMTFRVLGVCACVACSRAGNTASRAPNAGDTSFASMQARGKMAMGVDQTTSTHTFDALPDGGRIELLRDVDDSLGIAQIRAHLRLIEHAFQAGDFSTPQFVHMQEMPGTATMARKRDVITYSYHELPRGGEVDMKTSDAEALAAIHAFMEAQRAGHHAGGAGMTMSH
jgi:uncharacterized protein YjhX (UPF0386 family)